MPTDPLTVALAPWVHRLPGTKRGRTRRHAALGIVVGCLLLALVVTAGAVSLMLTPMPPSAWFGVALLGGTGTLLVWNGLRRRRLVGPGPADDPITFTAPHAFVLTDGALDFPAGFDRPAERWELADVTVSVERHALILRHPEHATRRFLGRALVDPPVRIAEQIETRRGTG